MKALLAISLAFGVISSFASRAVSAQERKISAAIQQKSKGLEVSLVAHKRRYKRSDQLKLQVMLKNSGRKNFYVFGTLGFGYSASFILHVLDASGKEIEPIGLFDDLTHESSDDESAFVKLHPNHFLGTNFFAPLDILNLNKPGKYAIFVEYHSPFPATDVQLNPFWGKENGITKSNVVSIEVVR